jgi:hypothetical protein
MESWPAENCKLKKNTLTRFGARNYSFLLVTHSFSAKTFDFFPSIFLYFSLACLEDGMD